MDLNEVLKFFLSVLFFVIPVACQQASFVFCNEQGIVYMTRGQLRFEMKFQVFFFL